MRPGKLKIIFLYALICFIWGSTWLGIKLGLEGVPALLGAASRFTLAGLLFLIPIGSRGIPLRLEKKHVRLILVVGISNFGLSYGLVYWSELHISSGLTSVLFCVYPFFVALLAHFWMGLEKLTWKMLAGITVGFVGIAWIYFDQMHGSTHSLKGMAAVLLASLGSSISLVFLKKHGRELNILVLNFYSMLTGSALLWMAFLFLERGISIQWSLKNVGALLYLAIFGSVIAFTIYFYLLKHLTATQMSFVALIYPVLALLLGSWVLGEKVSNKILVGSALVLIGIFIAKRAVPVNTTQPQTISDKP